MALIVSADSSVDDAQLYADLFKENHITGRRLLLLTEADMKDIGMRSKGHIIHLKVASGLCAAAGRMRP